MNKYRCYSSPLVFAYSWRKHTNPIIIKQMETLTKKMLQGEVHDATRRPIHQKSICRKPICQKSMFQMNDSQNSLADNSLKASLPKANF
jgi:hypothetical protein